MRGSGCSSEVVEPITLIEYSISTGMTTLAREDEDGRLLIAMVNAPRSPVQQDGTTVYHQDGFVHRADGPAVITRDGTAYYYTGGRFVTVKRADKAEATVPEPQTGYLDIFDTIPTSKELLAKQEELRKAAEQAARDKVKEDVATLLTLIADGLKGMAECPDQKILELKSSRVSTEALTKVTVMMREKGYSCRAADLDHGWYLFIGTEAQ